MKSGVRLDKMRFGRAFAAARDAGWDKFVWRGKEYTTGKQYIPDPENFNILLVVGFAVGAPKRK